MGPKTFGAKKSSPKRILAEETNFVQIEFCVKKTFSVQNIFGSIIIFVQQQILGPEILFGKKRISGT